MLFRILKSSPLSYLFSTFMFLFTVEVACIIFRIPEYTLPAPSSVFPYLVKNMFLLSKDLWFTLKEIILGFILGWGIAFVLSICTVFSPLLYSFVRPLIILSQTIPIIAVAPILIFWFGFGLLPKIITSALLVLFPVFVGITEGFLNVPAHLLDFMNASRAGRLQTFRYIQLANAVPNIIIATKIGITLSVIGAIIGEFITAEHGIGLVIRTSISQMNTLLTFTMLYILGFIGIFMYSILDMIELLIHVKYRKIE